MEALIFLSPLRPAPLLPSVIMISNLLATKLWSQDFCTFLISNRSIFLLLFSALLSAIWAICEVIIESIWAVEPLLIIEE